MTTQWPKISMEDARDICAYPWPSEQQAREQAAQLAAAGWHVHHRFPPVPFGTTGRALVASVYDPETFESPGDVCYRIGSSEPGE